MGEREGGGGRVRGCEGVMRRDDDGAAPGGSWGRVMIIW